MFFWVWKLKSLAPTQNGSTNNQIESKKQEVNIVQIRLQKKRGGKEEQQSVGNLLIVMIRSQ